MRELIVGGVLAIAGMALVGCNANHKMIRDATVVDPVHYTVEFENDQVRILRIKYGPGEESVLHQHPDSVVVFLTGGGGTFELPDGSKRDVTWNAGDAHFMSAETHKPTNTGAYPIEIIQVELK